MESIFIISTNTQNTANHLGISASTPNQPNPTPAISILYPQELRSRLCFAPVLSMQEASFVRSTWHNVSGTMLLPTTYGQKTFSTRGLTQSGSLRRPDCLPSLLFHPAASQQLNLSSSPLICAQDAGLINNREMWVAFETEKATSKLHLPLP